MTSLYGTSAGRKVECERRTDEHEAGWGQPSRTTGPETEDHTQHKAGGLATRQHGVTTRTTKLVSLAQVSGNSQP